MAAEITREEEGGREGREERERGSILLLAPTVLALVFVFCFFLLTFLEGKSAFYGSNILASA